LEKILSYLINFVIFIWVGKIVVNINIFIQDPLAILAYPSDANAFYIASVLIGCNVLYNIVRKNQSGIAIWNTFVPIFLVASFFYEFVQYVFFEDRQAWMALTFLMILLVTYVLLIEKVRESVVVF